MTAPERSSEGLPGRVEISADHGATAIGRVGNLNMADGGGIAIGSVENFNIFMQAAAAQKATTPVLPVASTQTQGSAFVGRQVHLDELTEFLSSGADGKSVAVVTGPPGVGKTALVRQAAMGSTSQNRFTRALFADLGGYEELAADRVQPSELYVPLLQGLGVPGNQIPEAVGDRASLYHHVLEARAAADQPALIWLDNVSDRGQVEELIPANRLHRVVVTTRETFPRHPNRHDIDLHVLAIDEAVELLARAIQVGDDLRIDSDPGASALLAELCDRLPLALQIVAALVADEPSRPIRDFAAELQEEEHRLDNLHYDDRLSVRAALTLSYKRLPDQLQRLFRLMSQVPGGDLSLDAGRWLIDASASAVRPQPMAMVRSHLIQQHVGSMEHARSCASLRRRDGYGRSRRRRPCSSKRSRALPCRREHGFRMANLVRARDLSSHARGRAGPTHRAVGVVPGIETALGVGLGDSEIREVSEYLAGGEYWADHHPAVSAPFDRPDKPKTSQ